MEKTYMAILISLWRNVLLNYEAINPLTPELNPSVQRCLTRIFTGAFASLTVHFVNICMKNQQMHQLFIQFINPLAPSDPYMGRTAQLTSRCCILNTYSTNIRSECFQHAA
jgi:hypothetical protein